MTAPDFAAIMGGILRQLGVGDGRLSAVALAAKVPELCSTCDEFERTIRPNGEQVRAYVSCDHREAPTIAKLLAIGAAVMSSQVYNDGEYVYGDWQENTYRIAGNLLQALRAVQP